MSEIEVDMFPNNTTINQEENLYKQIYNAFAEIVSRLPKYSLSHKEPLTHQNH